MSPAPRSPATPTGLHPGLSEWIATNTKFPNSMVDRITPVTTPEVITGLAEGFGIQDRWPVVAEPFTSWALEDHFSDGRPPFEDVGVLMVDAAWAPARVMAAVSAGHGVDAGRRFYEAFGSRFHVDLGTADHVDRVAVCRHALTDAELPAELFDAAHNPRWDEQLRTITRDTLDQVGLDVGVPVLLLDGVASSGPVRASIPRDGDATDLFDAVQTLTRLSGFVRYERQQQGPLLVA
jgi:hypothetical protein